MREKTHNPFGNCSKCGQQIIWVKTKAGKNMPYNPALVNYTVGGKEKIVLPNGEVVSGTIASDVTKSEGHGYISHFATCEYSNMFRRKKKNAGR